MPLSTEKVPNNPLTGPELKTFVLSLLERALSQEWVFNPGTSYPRVGVKIVAKFHFLSPSLPRTEIRVRPVPPVEGAPLHDIGEVESGVIALKIEKRVENPNLERVHAGIPIQVISKPTQAPGEMFPRVESHAVVYDKSEYPEPDPPKRTDISEETAKEWGVKHAIPPTEVERAERVVHLPPVPGVDRKRALFPERRGRVDQGVHFEPKVSIEMSPPLIHSTPEEELDAISTEEAE